MGYDLKSRSTPSGVYKRHHTQVVQHHLKKRKSSLALKPQIVPLSIPALQDNIENDCLGISSVQLRVVLPGHQNRSDISGKYNGLIWPRGNTLLHSAVPMLLDYAKLGCPVDCGENWSKVELQAAVEKTPHISSLLPDSAPQLYLQIMKEAKQGFCLIVK